MARKSRLIFRQRPEVTEKLLDPGERTWFPRVLQALNDRQIPYLVHGGFALYFWSGFWRQTKDLDILVLPKDRHRAKRCLTEEGLGDLFKKKPYDRRWIYRGTVDDVIVDLIWQQPNKVGEVKDAWFERATSEELLGIPVKLISPADLCWMKLYILNEERCDWPHIINIWRGTRGALDWELLYESTDRQHVHLLGALIHLFDFVSPGEERTIPDWFRRRVRTIALHARQRQEEPVPFENFLDSRPWLTEIGASLGSQW